MTTRWLIATCLSGLLAACSSEPHRYDPGARPLAAGQTCQSVRQDLDRLDRQGARGLVEAKSAGRSLSPQSASVVARYNDLLNQYLGARCHV